MKREKRPRVEAVFLPTDLCDGATGEPLYVWAVVLPRWRWRLRQLRLFLGIVWRPAWQDPHGFLWLRGRISVRTAWEVAAEMYRDPMTPERVRAAGFPPERVRP